MKRLLLPLRISLFIKVTDKGSLIGRIKCRSFISEFVYAVAPEVLPRQEVETSQQSVKQKRTDEVTQTVKQEYVVQEPQTVTCKFWS